MCACGQSTLLDNAFGRLLLDERKRRFAVIGPKFARFLVIGRSLMQQLLSRHDELKERARQLLEATKKEAREKDRNRRQNSKEKEEKSEVVNGLKNGEMSPKKVRTVEGGVNHVL